MQQIIGVYWQVHEEGRALFSCDLTAMVDGGHSGSETGHYAFGYCIVILLFSLIRVGYSPGGIGGIV